MSGWSLVQTTNFLRNTSWQFDLLPYFINRDVVSSSRRRNIFIHFLFCWTAVLRRRLLTCGLNCSFTSNKPSSNHLVNYEYFTYAPHYTCLFFKISLTNWFNFFQGSVMLFAAHGGTNFSLAFARNLIRHLMGVTIWVNIGYNISI